MLSERMLKTLNEQVNAEFYSAYLYLAMAAQFRAENLNGMAQWLEVQSMEEVTHAMKFYTYITDRGKQVVLDALDRPPTHWDSPLAAFQDAYAHEVQVTGMIHNLVDIALEEKDHATNSFLQWFVTEQIEEESSTDEVVQKLKMIKDAPAALYLLDQELGQRVFTIPPGSTLFAGAGGKQP